MYTALAVFTAVWALLSLRCVPLLGKWQSPWYWGCMAVALILFFVGLVVVGAACLFKAWRFPYARSIKPFKDRELVDGWKWPINLIYGNPEDGVSGIDAYGPSWTDSYNPWGTRWRAFVWSGLRNWANGLNYITWPWASAPPCVKKTYRTPWRSTRELQLGWTQLPASDGWVTTKVRMICSC